MENYRSLHHCQRFLYDHPSPRLAPELQKHMQFDTSMQYTIGFAPFVLKQYKTVDIRLSASAYSLNTNKITGFNLQEVRPVSYATFDERMSVLDGRLNSLQQIIQANQPEKQSTDKQPEKQLTE